jgi:hypothetical protein
MREIFEEFLVQSIETKFAPIQSSELKEYYPLSPQQKRMYSFDQIEYTGIVFNIQKMHVYCKGIEKEALEEAVRKLIKRQESLRTSFFTLEGEAVQKVHDFTEVGADFAVEYYEMSEDEMISSRKQEKGYVRGKDIHFKDLKELTEHFVRPFELTRPPLLRLGLIKIWGNTQILMLDIHNIVVDRFSLKQLEYELWELYDGEELPTLRLQYRDYSEWLRSEKGLEIIKEQEKFWLEEFAGEIPRINLPTDNPRPAKLTFNGSILLFNIDTGQTHQLKMMAQIQNESLFMILFAVYNILLAKISGQEDIVVGIDIPGRRYEGIERTVGMFQNTRAIRNYPTGEKIFADFLSEVKLITIAAFENQDYPFEQLMDRIAPQQEPDRNPLFDVTFGLVNEAINPDKSLLEILALDRSNPFRSRKSRYDMTLICIETGNGMEFSIEYNINLFKEETIIKFAEYFKRIVSSVCKDTRQKISEIEIIPGEKKNQKLIYLDKLESEARSMIKDGNYSQARSNLEEIIKEAPERKQEIQKEFGFLYNFNDSLENDEKSWKEKIELLQYWRKLWIIFADNNNFTLKVKKSILGR